MNRPEVLAPAGSPEALKAAVFCGADAVYFGFGRFHARQGAGEIPLEEAAAFCRARGVKTYITLNTLIRQDEWEEAVQNARRAVLAGADALIVQDRGLARMLSRECPDIPLHASTQLSCHTDRGVRELGENGFSRVILAREMEKDAIARCCRTGIQTEVFVHGAMCMSVSGQCLLSAALGKRSGNRGKCAQPCRLPFSVSGRPKESNHDLSLKDLSLVAHIRELAQFGVDSLKIEGRLKRPEYVAAAVTAMKAALRGETDSGLLSDLRDIFSRGGFTDAYYTGKTGADMFGSRTKEDAASSAAAAGRLKKLYAKECGRIRLDLSLYARAGQDVTLTADDEDGHSLIVTGGRAGFSKSPSEPERIRALLGRLGSTPFVPGRLSADIHDVFLPSAEVNAMRREAVRRMLALRERIPPRTFGPAAPSLPALPPPEKPVLAARLAHEEQWSEELARKCALVELPLSAGDAAWRKALAVSAVAGEIPRGLFGRDEAILKSLFRIKQLGVLAAVCHTADAVALCREAGLTPLGGFGLYAANIFALDAYAQEGLAAATLSPELSLRQMAFAEDAPLPCGAFVYGRLPLMLIAACPHRARSGCDHCPSRRGGYGKARQMTDRTGTRFPLACTGRCPDMLNSVPLYLADVMKNAPALSFWTLYFTDESPQKAVQIANAYIKGTPPEGGFTRGFAFRGVD